MVHHLIGSAVLFGAHAHIERAFCPKTEAARWVIELNRADSEIGKHAVKGERSEMLAGIRERGLHDVQLRHLGTEFASELFETLFGDLDGCGVSIEDGQAAFRTKPSRDGDGVSGETERHVGVGAASLHCE